MTTTRLVRPQDAEEITALLLVNRAFLAPTDPTRQPEYWTVAGQTALIDDQLARLAAGDSLPHVILDEQGAIVGRATLSSIVRGPFLSASLGYWVAEPENGRGRATAAVSSMLDVAFADLGLHRVEAGTLVDNVASQRVLQKNGFVRFGLAPRYLRIAGRWQDHVLFQRLNDGV